MLGADLKNFYFLTHVKVGWEAIMCLRLDICDILIYSPSDKDVGPITIKHPETTALKTNYIVLPD